MIKVLSLFLLFISYVSASYEVIDEENIFTIKTKDISFDELHINLEDEITFQSFVIVHKLDLAKSTAKVAEALEKKAVLKKGINILICKSSFTLAMHEENIKNITYCPLNISVYADEQYNYISYKKYDNFGKDDKIANEINEKLKNIVLKSLD